MGVFRGFSVNQSSFYQSSGFFLIPAVYFLTNEMHLIQYPIWFRIYDLIPKAAHLYQLRNSKRGRKQIPNHYYNSTDRSHRTKVSHKLIPVNWLADSREFKWVNVSPVRKLRRQTVIQGSFQNVHNPRCVMQTDDDRDKG